jgi:signal transduction histidine kinase/CheY-like chemotaxis protein
MDASGLAFYDGGEFFTVGEVPFSGMLEKVRRVLQRRSNGELAMTDSLKFEDQAFASIGADYAGCLLVEISQTPPTQLLWFRQEQRRYVDWGGDPRKSVLPDDATNARLSPRKSFDRWTQLVEGQSRPWRAQDLHRARAVGQFVAARKVEDANRRQNQFLTNLSHEIRTPMTAILGFVDLLGGNAGEADPLEQAKAIASIRGHGERLLKIIEQMIGVCQTEAGTLPVRRESIALLPWTRDLHQRYERAVTQRGLRFGCHLPGPLPKEIVSDRNLIDQILLALMENAIRFTPDGGVDLTFQAHPKANDHLEILVKDSGPGLAPENAKRVFQSFYQVDGTMTRERGGVGLGLTVARCYAEALGGTLELKESTPGLGTTFSLSLPFGTRRPVEWVTVATGEVESPAPGKSTIESPSPLLDHHVLLVEDSLDNQRLIAWHLRSAGAQVTVAENGRIAIETLRRLNRSKTDPDVILMDMQMPAMDGYQATETLRNLGCGIPIIALTAHAMTGEREKCLRCGCDEYITKPVDPQQLTRLILALSENSRVVKVGDLFP